MKNQQPTRYIILEEKPNPSTDYFVLPWVQKQVAKTVHPKETAFGSRDTESIENDKNASTTTTITEHHPQIQRLSWQQDIPLQWLEGACVVIVRYLTSNWRKTLLQHRNQLHSLVYFFDDDIPDIKASQGLPIKYRFKLYRYGARHFHWLKKQDARFFVSTPYLQKKYDSHNPTLLIPQQLASEQTSGIQETQTRNVTTKKNCRVFYHATASHRKEIEWLFGVMKEVLATSPMVVFEIVGDAKTRALYKNLPRTTIVDPMSWENYQQFIGIPGRNIGLAPHLDNPFNRARSYTKLFDIERAGAVGVLADAGPWANDAARKDLQSALGPDYLSRHVMVPMQQDRWVKTIKLLAEKLETDGLKTD